MAGVQNRSAVSADNSNSGMVIQQEEDRYDRSSAFTCPGCNSGMVTKTDRFCRRCQLQLQYRCVSKRWPLRACRASLLCTERFCSQCGSRRQTKPRCFNGTCKMYSDTDFCIKCGHDDGSDYLEDEPGSFLQYSNQETFTFEKTTVVVGCGGVAVIVVFLFVLLLCVFFVVSERCQITQQDKTVNNVQWNMSSMCKEMATTDRPPVYGLDGIRLIKESTGDPDDRGKVEVKLREIGKSESSGQWSSVCPKNIKETVVEVFCWMLHYTPKSPFFESVQKTEEDPKSAVLLSHVNCTGKEDSVTSCASLERVKGDCQNSTVFISCTKIIPSGTNGIQHSSYIYVLFCTVFVYVFTYIKFLKCF